MQESDDARPTPVSDETSAGIRELIDSRLLQAAALETAAFHLRGWAAQAQRVLDQIPSAQGDASAKNRIQEP